MVEGVVLQLGWVCGDEIRGPTVETGADGTFHLDSVPETPPRARPHVRDIRWMKLLQRYAEPDPPILILEVHRPDNLLSVNGGQVSHFGLLGSRNTCEVEPGDRDVRLVVSRATGEPASLFRLRSVDGEPVRTVTNLVVVSPKDMRSGATIVFGGTTGNPMKLHDTAALDGCLVGILSRSYATPFFLVQGEELPKTVILEPRRNPPFVVELRDRDGNTVPGQPLFFSPESSSERFLIHLGTTDQQGVLEVSFLPCDSYEVFTIPRSRKGRWRPQISVISEENPTLVGAIHLIPGGSNHAKFVVSAH